MSLLALIGAEPDGAIISRDKVYRYSLWRIWDHKKPLVMWVMLNPSTANAREDDPTVRRVRGFSQAAGYGGFYVGNLFAYRSTDPDALRQVRARGDVVGPDNDQHLCEIAARCANAVCAWGGHGDAKRRAEHVEHLLRDSLPPGGDLLCLGITSNRQPHHPLYISKSRKFVSLDGTRVLRALTRWP